MKLIGMLDSPYVRRVAVSFRFQNIPFEHHPMSVFSAFDEFAGINPVVKAPTLVADDGTVLMESGLILELGERMAGAGLGLAPTDIGAFVRAQRIIGLALVACEKTVQIVYENNLRPAERRHQPWIDRVQGQLVAACQLLENEVRLADPWLFGARPLQADITSAVAFRFALEMLPDTITPEVHPALASLSARAEATDPFCAFPFS